MSAVPTLIQLLVACACLAAGIMQLAVHRAPEVNDPDLKRSGRRVMVVALMILGSFIGIYGWLDRRIEPVIVLGVGCVALAQIMFAIHKLFPNRP